MSEQPVNLPMTHFGVFSRAEQRVLQTIFKAIAEHGGRCDATLTMLARDSNTSKSTTRNAITQAIEIGLLEKNERRFHCAVSLPNILTYGKQYGCLSGTATSSGVRKVVASPVALGNGTAFRLRSAELVSP